VVDLMVANADKAGVAERMPTAKDLQRPGAREAAGLAYAPGNRELGGRLRLMLNEASVADPQLPHGLVRHLPQ
jgi:hypothetical protein